MGLLGGFKGKLIGKPKKKKKESAGDVVCVRFKVFSEFDDWPNNNDLPSCSKTNPGPNEVIKESRRPTIKPDIKTLWPPNDTVNKMNGDITPLPPIKSETVENNMNFEPPKMHDTNVGLRSSSSNYDDVEMSSDDDEIPPNFHKMSKTFAEDTKFAKETSKNDSNQAMETNYNENEDTSDDDDNDGNFKIHIAQTSRDSNLSIDDDDDVQHEIETLPDETAYQSMSTLTYSSQAESIFFGAEEKPVARPRNFVFTGKDNDDDDDDNISQGSSASA